MVMEDLRNEIISHWVAQNVCHVAYDPATLEVDYKKTEELRQNEFESRKSRGKKYEDFVKEWSQKRPPEEAIVLCVAMAEIARREGLLALDPHVSQLHDGFLRRAMHMAIDGIDPATIQAVMQREMESIDLRHTHGRGMLESLGLA